ncbi:MAG: aspartate kinase [Candidatus Colwellbacteria bacterium]
MALIVQKYGGTSLGDVAKIKKAAKRVTDLHRATGDNIIVVVSAMGHTTDELLAQAREINPAMNRFPDLDMLLTAGERISMALMSMAIQEQGLPAVGLTGDQAGIVTDDRHGQARILRIDTDRIEELLHLGLIVVVAGFQGISSSGKVTTLGRGGSDTTAVALAARLGADVCEIYTDVKGVLTADPRLVENPLLVTEMSYGAATHAGQVIHPRAVGIGERSGVLIHVLSSFEEGPGTIITREEDLTMEGAIINGVREDSGWVLFRIRGIQVRNPLTRITQALDEAGVSIDVLTTQIDSESGTRGIDFTVSTSDAKRAEEAIRRIILELRAKRLEKPKRVTKVTIYGSNLNAEPGIARLMVETLESHDLTIQGTDTGGDESMACLISPEEGKRAVSLLHDAFEDKLGPVVPQSD